MITLKTIILRHPKSLRNFTTACRALCGTTSVPTLYHIKESITNITYRDSKLHNTYNVDWFNWEEKKGISLCFPCWSKEVSAFSLLYWLRAWVNFRLLETSTSTTIICYGNNRLLSLWVALQMKSFVYWSQENQHSCFEIYQCCATLITIKFASD